MGSEHARFAILVSIRRFLGMGNSLGPFSDTSDWPKWPKWQFSAIHGHSNDHKMAKLVTLVLSMIETWFWCLSPDFGAWEIHWDHFQTPQNNPSGQNGTFWPFMATQITIKKAKLVTLVLSMLETWCLFPGFVAWEILCDHFQKPQNDLSGQSGHLWPLKLP